MATIFLASCYVFIRSFDVNEVSAVQILSKSKLEKCERVSDSGELNCTRKIVLNMAVPSGSSGGEASLVAEIAEVEENSTNKMHTVRIPPSAVTHEKKEDYRMLLISQLSIMSRLGNVNLMQMHVLCRYVKADNWLHIFVVNDFLRFLDGCRLRDENGHIIEHTQEVFVGPHNRTVTSADNFLRVNLIGDFVGYTNVPSFEDFYLVTPRVGGAGQPPDLGNNFTMWMLLERVRFTLDGLECNKIGVGFDAFSGQPNFCSSPLWSCLHYQLWNFREADQNRISRHQVPLYVVDGRFERINQHPNAGSHSFSIGITEAVSSNLLIELSADDIEYVYQRSPGKILSITIPTFEALTQFGTATVTVRNIGEVEASYSLTFDCERSVALMEEQYFILKPKETTTRSFKLYPATDQAASYKCSAILKDSEFNESDRAECQFATTDTIIDNGTQVPFPTPKKTGIKGFFEAIKNLWITFWIGLADFFTGRSCRSNCSGFFDLGCHIQYICMSWIILFGLFLAIFPTVLILIWLLHQKGLFDPIYDWWEEHFVLDEEPYVRHKRRHHDLDVDLLRGHHHKHGKHRTATHNHKHGHHGQNKELKISSDQHKNQHLDRDATYNYYLHHVHKDRQHHKHRRTKEVYSNEEEHRAGRHHRRRKSETEALPHVGRHHNEAKHAVHKHH
ncbi:unnamed protein product [Rhodiola kirilowii]